MNPRQRSQQLRAMELLQHWAREAKYWLGFVHHIENELKKRGFVTQKNERTVVDVVRARADFAGKRLLRLLGSFDVRYEKAKQNTLNAAKRALQLGVSLQKIKQMAQIKKPIPVHTPLFEPFVDYLSRKTSLGNAHKKHENLRIRPRHNPPHRSR